MVLAELTVRIVGDDKHAKETIKSVSRAGQQMSTAAKGSTNEFKTAMRQASQAARDSARDQVSAARKSAQDQKSYWKEIEKAQKAAFNSMQGNVRSFGSGIGTNATALKGWAKSIAAVRTEFGLLKYAVAAVGIAGVGAGIFAGAKSIIQTTVAFEGYNARLLTVLKDQSRVNDVMGALMKFAKETPFEIGEVTDAYTRLANYGINPTYKRMIALGNLAASNPMKSFQDAVEAVADAMQGQFRRLQDFGIRKEQIAAMGKNLINAKGQITDYAKWQEAVFDLLAKRNTGSMSNMMDTVAGRWSNLKDSITRVLMELGFGLRGTMKDSLEAITRMIDKFHDSPSFAALRNSLKEIFKKENLKSFTTAMLTLALQIGDIVNKIYDVMKWVEEKSKSPIAKALTYHFDPSVDIPRMQRESGSVLKGGELMPSHGNRKGMAFGALGAGSEGLSAAERAKAFTNGLFQPLPPAVPVGIDPNGMMIAHKPSDALSIDSLAHQKPFTNQAMLDAAKKAALASTKRTAQLMADTAEILGSTLGDTAQGIIERYNEQVKKIGLEQQKSLLTATTPKEKTAVLKKADALLAKALKEKRDSLTALLIKVTNESADAGRAIQESRLRSNLSEIGTLDDSAYKFRVQAELSKALSDLGFQSQINKANRTNKGLAASLAKEAKFSRMDIEKQFKDNMQTLVDGIYQASLSVEEKIVTGLLNAIDKQVNSSLLSDEGKQQLRGRLLGNTLKTLQGQGFSQQGLQPVRSALTGTSSDLMGGLRKEIESVFKSVMDSAVDTNRQRLKSYAKQLTGQQDENRRSDEAVAAEKDRQQSITNRLTEALADQRSVLGELTGKTDDYKAALARLNLVAEDSAGKLTDAHKRLINQFTKNEQFLEYAKGLESIFFNAFANINQGFGGLIRSIIQGVDQMIAQIAAKKLAAAATNAVMDLLTSVIGISLGASGKGSETLPKVAAVLPAMASGGSVNAYQPYLVGERGPELFMPMRNGSIVPNHELSHRDRDSQPLHVTINFNSPRGQQFNYSHGQVAESAFMAGYEAAKRNGH